MSKKAERMARAFRLTVERLDEVSGMARVEMIPSREGLNVEELSRSMVACEGEHLDWWDLRASSTRDWAPSELRETLGLRHEEPLAENMVFWVIGDPQRPEEVYHATPAARELSKRLYFRLTGSESDPQSQGRKKES